MRHAYRTIAVVVQTVLLIPAFATAEDAGWSVLIEPGLTKPHGHDPHVLTIHERDLTSNPNVVTSTPLTLNSESELARRLALSYTHGKWTAGFDFFFLSTSQGRPTRTAAAGAPLDEVVFETAGRSYTSDDPSEVLTFTVLDDTDVGAWTADLYAQRSVTSASNAGIDLLFGLRNADFDNDFHSIVAIEDIAGTRYDASSNYGRMTGPLVGLVGDVRLGASTLRARLSQSIVFGSVELHRTIQDFSGPVATPTFTSVETFAEDEDVAIPITEFGLSWLYPVTKRLSVGASAHASVWTDVPVPPGIEPTSNGDGRLQENTIQYFGLSAALKIRI